MLTKRRSDLPGHVPTRLAALLAVARPGRAASRPLASTEHPPAQAAMAACAQAAHVGPRTCSRAPVRLRCSRACTAERMAASVTTRLLASALRRARAAALGCPGAARSTMVHRCSRSASRCGTMPCAAWLRSPVISDCRRAAALPAWCQPGALVLEERQQDLAS